MLYDVLDKRKQQVCDILNKKVTIHMGSILHGYQMILETCAFSLSSTLCNTLYNEFYNFKDKKRIKNFKNNVIFHKIES